MHPIERLRYVARASGADQALLVRETAAALGAFADDPPGLVAACRRVIERHPTSGPLWWLCSRVLTTPDDVRAEASHAADEIELDRTARELAAALADDATACVVGWPEIVGEALPRRGDVEVLAVDSLGEGSGLVRRLGLSGIDAVEVATSGLGAAVASSDVLLLEAVAMGPTGFVGVSGSLAAAAVARHADVPVWVVVGVGRLLPARVWDAVTGRQETRLADPWDLDEEVVPLSLVDAACGPGGLQSPTAALLGTDCPVAPELFDGGSAPGTHRG
jgi:hypothetical protein